MPNWVTGPKVDEISTVDVPAHQDALFVLAKRAEESTVGDYFDAEGDPVDITSLNVGDWFQDEGGHAFQFVDEQGGVRDADGQEFYVEIQDGGDGSQGEPVYDGPAERELEQVGKSAFFQQTSQAGEDLFAKLSKSLSEAIADDGARTEIAKAFADQQVELAKAQRVASDAMEIAKAAQTREEERAFISKAAEYEGLPVTPEDLGPVLHRMTKALSYEDCAVIAKCLENTGDIFKQYGIDGDFDAVDDPFEQVEKYMSEHAEDALEVLGKSANGADGKPTRLSKEHAITAAFSMNPREYTMLKRQRRG